MIGSADDPPAAMIDQIHHAESRAILHPVRPGADGDLVFEKRAGLCRPPPLSRPAMPTSQQSINGCGTDSLQLLVAFRADLEEPRFVQALKLVIERGAQSLGSHVIEQLPQNEQRPGLLRAVCRPPRTFDGPLGSLLSAIQQCNGILARDLVVFKNSSRMPLRSFLLPCDTAP